MLQSNYTDSGEIEFIINKADYDQLRVQLANLQVFMHLKKQQHDQLSTNHNQLKEKYLSLQKEYQKAVNDFGNYGISQIDKQVSSQKKLLLETTNNPFEQLQKFSALEEEINQQKTIIQNSNQKESQQNELISCLNSLLTEQKKLLSDATQKYETKILDLNQQVSEIQAQNSALQNQLIELDNRNLETESQKNQILSSHYSRKEENLQLKLQTDNANSIINKLEKEKRDLIEQSEEKSKKIALLQLEKSELIQRAEKEQLSLKNSYQILQGENERLQAEYERVSFECYDQKSKIQTYLQEIHKQNEENKIFQEQVIRLSREYEQPSLNELLVQIFNVLVREISICEGQTKSQRTQFRDQKVKSWAESFNVYLRKPLEGKCVTFKHEFRDNYVEGVP